MKKRTWFWVTLSREEIAQLKQTHEGKVFYEAWSNARTEARTSWLIGCMAAFVIAASAGIILHYYFPNYYLIGVVVAFFGALVVGKYSYLAINHFVFKKHHEIAYGVSIKTNEPSVKKISQKFEFFS